VAEGSQTATLANNTYDEYSASTCTDASFSSDATPLDWTYTPSPDPTLLDPSNTSNVFRGNVTTNVAPDITHTLCYDRSGAVVLRFDGGHRVTVNQTSGTNYSAPSAITTSGLTTNLSWTNYLGLSSTTGPNGDNASITYDSAARPSSTTSPYGATTTYSYSTSAPQVIATTNGRSRKKTTDGFGRTTKTELTDTSGNVQTVQTSSMPLAAVLRWAR
jgi:hypothetical protein